MSKERELLESTIEYLYDLQSAWLWKKDEVAGNGEEYNDLDNLIVKIREHLSQPEQEQEPVAWMWEENTSDGWVESADTDKPPENEYRRNIQPLYLAPPKREPLSDGEIRDGLNGKNGFENWYDDRFVDGVRFAEKHHGIGGGE